MRVIHCPMCSHRYNPAENAACGTCPLHSGCSMVCCPSCGHSTIDPGQSKLVSVASMLFPFQKSTTKPDKSIAQFFGAASPQKGEKSDQMALPMRNSSSPPKVHGGVNGISAEEPPNLTLADVSPDSRVQVAGFAGSIPPRRRARLQAYGLVPGYWVRVLQQNPVTVVQIEHIELALEDDLAREVLVRGERGG